VVRVIVCLAHVALNYRNFFQEDLREMLHSLGKWSISGVVFCLICIMVTALTGFTRTVSGETLEYKSILSMDSSKVEFFEPLSGIILLQSVSGIFYTFLNPQFIFPLISHLKRPTRKRVDRIFQYSHYELLLVYLGIGILGYLLLSQHVDVVPISSLVVISIPTPPMLLGKLVLAVAMFFLFPLQVFTARELSYEAFDIERSPAHLQKMNYVIVGTTCLIALIFQQVTTYFGFIGGTMGVMMAVLIPALCMRKLVPCSTTGMVLYGIAIVMSVVLFAGAI
jgi:amino acid permease